MKTILKTTAIAAAALTLPATASAQSYYAGEYSPHQACKKKEDKKQIIGGLLGAVAGGVLGSQVSGNGARTEGSAIGAVVGGLAGAGIADKTIDCDPSYPTSSYGEGTYQPTSYGHSTGYSSGGYQNVGYSSQNQYQDRVTVSNHPVYSDPTYGATYGTGAVSQGTTYNTGTVSYPPQLHTQGYRTTYEQVPMPSTQRVYQASHSQPVYSQPTYTRPTYTQPTYTQQSVSTPSYRSYGATHSSGYITRDPYYRPKPVGGVRHFHGSFECNGIH